VLPQLRSAADVSMIPDRCQPGLLHPKQLHTTHWGSSAQHRTAYHSTAHVFSKNSQQLRACSAVQQKFNRWLLPPKQLHTTNWGSSAHHSTAQHSICISPSPCAGGQQRHACSII
jgi:hypothetical protein